MALSITTELQSTYYTCDIPNIGIDTDRASLVFTLKVKGKQIFKSTYYASNGKVTVRDILSIIEAYFVQQGYSYQTVNITADDGDEPVTATFHAVYCHFHCISKPAEVFVEENFFTTATSRVVSLNCPQPLAGYYSRGRHSVRVSAMYQLPDGTTKSTGYTESINVPLVGMKTITVNPATIEEELSDALHMDVKLLQFSYEIESRRCHFFIQRTPSTRSFYFWNAFNCKEAVTFFSETVTELETDFSEAVIEHQLAYYDVEHTHTYQTQTGDLLLMQARWLEQFFTSPKIQLAQKINGTNPLVLIADYEHQITDAPGSNNQVNFKWKFADKRLTLNDFSLDDGIFTEPYSEEYV